MTDSQCAPELTSLYLQAHLDEIVSDVMDIAAQLVKKNVRLSHFVDPATPVITADKKRLTQILFNLMGNALKFTHQGNVIMSIKPAASLTEVQYSQLLQACALFALCLIALKTECLLMNSTCKYLADGWLATSASLTIWVHNNPVRTLP